MARNNTRRMHTLRTEFRAASEAKNAPCWVCDALPIDYAAKHNDWKNDSRFQLDHYWSVSTHPHLQEDPNNFRASHAGCNRDRGNQAPDGDLGIPSRVWT